MMNILTAALPLGAERISRRALAFLALTKPRLLLLVLAVTAMGFLLASAERPDYILLLLTLSGIALASGGTLALNQLAEQKIDAIMKRTRERPLPSGRLLRGEAFGFGVFFTLAGVFLLAVFVNLLAGVLSAFSATLYLFVYTPLKRMTPGNIMVGAVSGALPPVIGWAGGAGAVGMEAGFLFAVLFLWQIPHVLAVGVLYREEFAKAGIRLLSVDEPDWKKAGRQAVRYSIALLLMSLLPSLGGYGGGLYFFSALALGLGFSGFGIHMARARTVAAAQRLFIASLVYLPLLLLSLVIDRSLL